MMPRAFRSIPNLCIRLAFFWIASLSMLVLCSATASASPLDLYGFSSRSIGRAGAATASVDDYSAIYYNPGRMGFIKPHFGFHLAISFDDVEINLDERPSGYDVPVEVYDSIQTGGDATKATVRYLPTDEILSPRQNTTDDPMAILLSGGIVHDFGLDWFRLGIAFQVPLQTLLSYDFHFVDEREQFFSNQLYFQLLNRKVRRPTALGSIAFRPLDWLGFGLAVNVFANVAVKSKMFVPDALEQETIYFAMDTDIRYDAALSVGLQIEPLDWFGLGINFRDRSWFNAEINNELQFWNFEIYQGEPITKQTFRYAASFSPRTLSAGLRFDIPEAVTISVDAAWLRWSEFQDEIAANGTNGFEDTYTVRLGFQAHPIDWLEVRAGVAWLPTPVPEQTGRTNYVDNDRVEASIGNTYHLPWVEGLSLEWHLQFEVLVPRSHTKDPDLLLDEFPESVDIRSGDIVASSEGLQTNNPGFPGYSSKGFVGTVGIGLNYAY